MTVTRNANKTSITENVQLKLVKCQLELKMTIPEVENELPTGSMNSWFKTITDLHTGNDISPKSHTKPGRSFTSNGFIELLMCDDPVQQFVRHQSALEANLPL